MGKREEFKKNLAALGAIGTLALGTYGIDAIEKGNDLSRYTVDDNKYVDYINENDNKKMVRLEKLDDNIKKYEELVSKKSLNEEETSELKELTDYLKREMKSGYLERFFLQNVFKGKLKEAYGAKDIETRWRADEGMHVKLSYKDGTVKAMEDKDKVKPLVVALKDIVVLQGYENKDDFSESEIENFIKIQKNMKGFSNLSFIKVDNKPLAYTQINLDKDTER